MLSPEERSRLEMETQSTGLSDQALIDRANNYSKGAYYISSGASTSRGGAPAVGAPGSSRSSVKLVFGGLSDTDPMPGWDNMGSAYADETAAWEKYRIDNEAWAAAFYSGPASTPTGISGTDGGGSSAFALGTPSTSMEGLNFSGPDGSARVNVHPDEAIVPLSDGRSIPVMLKGGGNSGRAQISMPINITIHTKDAQSFKDSEEQLLQKLSAQMRQAAKIIGDFDVTDDPTKRPSKKS
jgi:hypothetical protein